MHRQILQAKHGNSNMSKVLADGAFQAYAGACQMPGNPAIANASQPTRGVR